MFVIVLFEFLSVYVSMCIFACVYVLCEFGCMGMFVRKCDCM